MRHRNYEGPGNPIEACTEVIAGKWKGEILYLLLNGSKRHGELRRLIPKVTQRMLTNQLGSCHAFFSVTDLASACPTTRHSLRLIVYYEEPL